MRVFWYNGGLHIEPESKSETDLLSRVVKSLRFEEPPKLGANSDGLPVLSGQDALELLIGNQQPTKSGVQRQQIHKQSVIPIRKVR